MMNILRQFRMSADLDSPRPHAPSDQAGANRSEELQRFRACLAGVDRHLKRPPPLPEVSEPTHQSFMRAIRSRDRCQLPRRGPRFALGLSAATALLLALFAAWRFFPFNPLPPSVSEPQLTLLESAGAAFQVGERLTEQMPAALFTPLSEELNRVNADLAETAEFLLASIP